MASSPVLVDDRACLLPIKYPTLYKRYLDHMAAFWTPAEVDMSADLDHWDEATDDEREMLKKILSFFAVADGIVMANVSDNFADEVKAPEARCFYAFQNAMESIHVVVYNETIETYLRRDEKEKMKLLSNVAHYGSVKAKVSFAQKWMKNDRTFAERLVAFACIEGILFSSSFAIIYWFKDQNRFPGLTFSNELISRDEALHTDFAVELHKHLLPSEQCSKATIRTIVADAVKTEQAFVSEAVPNTLGTLSVDSMCQYVEHVGNVLLGQFGITTSWIKLSKELHFMQHINLNQKTNFFEARVSNYVKHEPVDAVMLNVEADF
tara:strand:+ start:3060 stop:4025 length:966 start_codon:yes stop_codon:yes gene_type:complete